MSQEALERVKVPAIGLVITGALGLLGGVVSLVSWFAFPEFSQQSPMPGWEWVSSPALNLGYTAFSMALSAFVFVGGLKMGRLESYGFVITSSIVAIVPCFSCCLTGMPFGIWAVIVLLNEDVKREFQ